MLRGQIDSVDHCGLPAFYVEVVDRVKQEVLVGRELLKVLDLLAVDKTFQESFVATLVAVDDRLGGVDHLIQLGTQRTRSVYGQTIDDGDFFLGKRKNRLRHAVFEDLKVVLRDVVNRMIVAIDHAHVQRHQLGVEYYCVALADFRFGRIGYGRRLRFQDWRRRRRTELRRDATPGKRLLTWCRTGLRSLRRRRRTGRLTGCSRA